MSEVQENNTIRVHYTGKLEDGTVFDSSREREPIEFEVGAGTVIPGLEKAVIGMNTGESKSFTVEPDDAFGEFRDDLIRELDRKEFAGETDLESGQQYQASGPNGEQIVITVVEVADEVVVVDANHPLAGKNLEFDVELVEIVS